MVDEALILRKLSELDQYCSQLKEYENTTSDQYSDDWKIQRIIERTLQMMIETCADIAGHIIADMGFRIPTSYADTFKVLLEEKILDRKLYANLKLIYKAPACPIKETRRHVPHCSREQIQSFLKKRNRTDTPFSHAFAISLHRGPGALSREP